MLYRVVLQGNVAQGADVETVRREFVRVTGLPSRVAESLFAGTPRVIKRQIAEADAERIAGTLRAIGAQATVEREPTEGLAPLNTPTVTPATAADRAGAKGSAGSAGDDSEAGASAATLVAGAARRRRLLYVAGAAAAVFAALVAAPAYDEFVKAWRRSQAASAAAVASAKPNPATPADEERTKAAPPNPAHLQGPWRCTDPNTGVAQYWSYADDGRVVFQGAIDFSKGEKPLAGPEVPVRWSLAGDRLTWAYEGAKPAASVQLVQLSLMRLDYRNAAGDVTSCRRP